MQAFLDSLSLAKEKMRGRNGRRYVQRVCRILCSLPHIGRELLFFTLLYLYLCVVIEPHLIFHGSDRITNFPSFYKTSGFLISHLSRPGGPVEYLSAFLSQLFYFSWLGALVIALQAWALGLLVAYPLRATGFRMLQSLRYAPALLLLILYGRYTYFFPTTMALAVALALACVYVRATMSGPPARGMVSFLVLSLVCYYVAGGAMLLFALMCIIRESLLAGRRRLGILYAPIAAGLPYLFGVQICGAGIINAYGDLLPVSWKLLHFAARRRGVEAVYILYLLAPVGLAVGGIASVLWARWVRDRQSGKGRAGREREGTRVRGLRAVLSRCVRSPACRRPAGTTTLIAVAVAVAYGGFDARQKAHFAVDYYAYHKRWPALLVAARKARDDPFVMHAVNRALYHTGQLGETMFAWPQNRAYLFLADPQYKWVHWQYFAAHLEMGAVNVADNALVECLAGMGDRPMILQQLARVNLVKGNVDAARVYLRALTRTLFHSTWARSYLELVQRDPDLATDRDIQHVRSIAMDEDYPLLDLSREDMLLSLLEENRTNRMAFEYLMAWYLLDRQLTRFVKHLDGLRDLGYQTLPRHYEEAVMVYAATARTSIQLGGYRPRDDVRQEMADFVETLRRHGADTQAALADLAKHHGHTYAFYNVYGPRKKPK